jgi:hypothetical protein
MKNKIYEDINRIKNLMFGESWKTLDELEGYSEELGETEMSEDDATTTTSSGSAPSAGYPSVTKWESGATRGKANPIANNKWETGVKRGKANTLL